MKLIATIFLALAINGAQVKEWCVEGQKCIEQGDGLAAAQYYKKCHDVLGTGKNAVSLSVTLYNIAMMYEDAGDYAEAEKYIKRAIGLGEVLGRTGSLVLRYKEASAICLAQGRKEDALEYALAALDLAKGETRSNGNSLGIAGLQAGECYSALGQYAVSDSLYNESINEMINWGKGKVFVPQAYLKLAENATRAGDTEKARYYYELMLQETHIGYDQMQMYTACSKLAELLAETDPSAAAEYAALADSLDFAPAVDSLGKALALSNIEFPRREREAQIAAEHQHARLYAVLAGLTLLVAALLLGFGLMQQRFKKMEEQKNADLIKALLQKDALLEISAKEHADQEELEERRRIFEDDIPMPEVKLTKREIQIARMTGEGKINKEIAEELGISANTVAVHKNNLYRKLGVGNSVELLRYLQKLGMEE